MAREQWLPLIRSIDRVNDDLRRKLVKKHSQTARDDAPAVITFEWVWLEDDLNPLVDLAQFLAIFEERASIIPQGTGFRVTQRAAARLQSSQRFFNDTRCAFVCNLRLLCAYFSVYTTASETCNIWCCSDSNGSAASE